MVSIPLVYEETVLLQEILIALDNAEPVIIEDQELFHSLYLKVMQS
jgi:hypothetical protein